MKEQPLKKVVMIGPESTGKSILCTQLAKNFGTVCCGEYAREYLLKHGANYTYDDLLLIAKGQLHREDAASEKALELHKTVVFIDTDMYVMKVWCEFVFNKCHQFILNAIAERKYDLYLLCNTDVPWVKDELREYPDHQTRLLLYNMYKDLLINQQVKWTDIKGNYSERLQNSMLAVQTL